MTSQRITTDRELAELRSMIARNEAHAVKLRERSTRPSVEDIAERMRNAPVRMPVDGPPLAPEHVAANAKAVHGILSGTPSLATRALGEQFETEWRATDSVVETFYEERRELRWFDLLAGADDRLRKPADDAAAAFAMGTAPGLPAIVATSRPSQPWVMHSRFELSQAIAAIADDIHCDLQISGATVIRRKRYRNCVDWFASLRYDDLIRESFITLPVARGDLIVLVRVCCWCIAAYQGQNSVDITKCVVEEPYSDGFGSLLTWNVSTPLPAESDCDTDDGNETDDEDDDCNHVEP